MKKIIKKKRFNETIKKHGIVDSVREKEKKRIWSDTRMTTRGIRRKKSSLSEVKIAVIGCQGVGKSALSVRFLTKRYIGEYDHQTGNIFFVFLNRMNFYVKFKSVNVRWNWV